MKLVLERDSPRPPPHSPPIPPPCLCGSKMWLSAASHLQPPGKVPAAPVFILALNAGKGSNVSSSLQVSKLDFRLIKVSSGCERTGKGKGRRFHQASKFGLPPSGSHHERNTFVFVTRNLDAKRARQTVPSKATVPGRELSGLTHIISVTLKQPQAGGIIMHIFQMRRGSEKLSTCFIERGLDE